MTNLDNKLKITRPKLVPGVSFGPAFPAVLSLLISMLSATVLAAPPQPDGNDDTSDWLTFDLVHRTRYETLDGQFRSRLNGGDQALSLYTSASAKATGKRWHALAELIDARAYLTDNGGAADSNLVDTAELAQAHIGLHLESLGSAVTSADLVAGRMTYTMGAGRLIGRNHFRNMPNAFTGVRLELNGHRSDRLTLLYLMPHRRLPQDQASVLDNEVEFDGESFDTQLWGVHYQAPLVAGASFEAFAVGLHERDSSKHQTRNRQLYTIGTRLFRPPMSRRIDFDIEGGVQTGNARATVSPLDLRDLDVFAGYLHAESGYVSELTGSPRIALLFDYASGDGNPNDGRYGRFDGLYGPVRGDLGPTSIYTYLTRSNLISPGLRIETSPALRADVMLTWRAVWLASGNDSFSQTGVRDAGGNSGRFAGHQLDLRARYWVVPERVRVEAGAAAFLNGGFLKAAPNAPGEGDTLYGYADITFKF